MGVCQEEKHPRFVIAVIKSSEVEQLANFALIVGGLKKFVLCVLHLSGPDVFTITKLVLINADLVCVGKMLKKKEVTADHLVRTAENQLLKKLFIMGKQKANIFFVTISAAVNFDRNISLVKRILVGKVDMKHTMVRIGDTSAGTPGSAINISANDVARTNKNMVIVWMFIISFHFESLALKDIKKPTHYQILSLFVMSVIFLSRTVLRLVEGLSS